MLPMDEALVVTNDYLLTATDLHFVVAGDHAHGWFPKVRGADPVDGAPIGVAYYELEYERKADAMKRARQMLSHIKSLRRQFGFTA